MQFLHVIEFEQLTLIETYEIFFIHNKRKIHYIFFYTYKGIKKNIVYLELLDCVSGGRGSTFAWNRYV